MRTLWRAVILLLLTCRLSASELPDGLYARLVTSMGTITLKLYYDQTPRTVANFVGLAEGTHPFIDFAQPNVVKRHFYDGLIFHRVVKGFVIQTGSPNGNGTDGPGYVIGHEIKAGLKHGKAGMLGAARTSAQNTYGAQFYLTLTNTPFLDNQYTVWGETVEGLDVVLAIGSVATGANDKPLTPVVLQTVEILRIGAAALAFDPEKVVPALPQPKTKEVTLVSKTNSLTLSWRTNSAAYYRVLYGTDFKSWQDSGLFFDSSADLSGFLTQQPKYFFRLFEIQY